MSDYTFDRLVPSAGVWTFDRLVDVLGVPTILSLGTVQDGAAIVITGLAFSGSGNSVLVTQGDTEFPIAIAAESATEITTASLDTTLLYLTQPLTITVSNASALDSNSVSASIIPRSGEAADAISQEFLGDISSRASGDIATADGDLVFSNEVRIRNVQGTAVTIANVRMTGQGAFEIDYVGGGPLVTSFEYAIQDGIQLGAYATVQWIDPPSTAAVPNVRDQTIFDAQVAIGAAGFLYSVLPGIPDATILAGRITSQFPAAAFQLVLGGTVEITPSLGSLLTNMPTLTGIRLEDAILARSAAGLIGNIYRYIDGLNSGYVLNQTVIPGTVVAVGSSVDLVYSSNLAPIAVGLELVDAAALLQAANLTVDTPLFLNSSTTPRGVVMNQSPLPETIVTPGALFLLIVSDGPLPTMPGTSPHRRRLATPYS